MNNFKLRQWVNLLPLLWLTYFWNILRLKLNTLGILNVNVFLGLLMTLVIWAHGRPTLDPFLSHLNIISPHSIYDVVESNKFLPFLDALFTKITDGSITHKIYRKIPTLILIMIHILTATHLKYMTLLNPSSTAPLKLILLHSFPQ